MCGGRRGAVHLTGGRADGGRPPARRRHGFRGADPHSLARFRERFGAETLRLTCCFRCPRRVVRLARHLQPHIRPAPAAALGTVDLRFTSRPWATTLAAVDGLPPTEGVMFLSRCNRPLLELLEYAHGRASAGRRLQWTAPAVLGQLTAAVGRAAAPGGDGSGGTLCDVLAAAERLDVGDARAPADPTVLRILRTAVRLEGASGAADGSPWLTYVRTALQGPEEPPGASPAARGPPSLVLATIHAAPRGGGEGAGPCAPAPAGEGERE